MRFGFFLREAMRAMRRNAAPSFAALATVLVTMLVLGVFIPIVQATNGAANSVRSRVLVDVYMKTSATGADVQRVQKEILALPHVHSVEYVSKQQAYEQQALHERAIEEFHEAIVIGGHADSFDANLAYSLASSGRRQEANIILANMLSRNEHNPSAQSIIALIYVGLGDKDQALAWLGKAYESRFNPSILLRPTFDALRTDARFQTLRGRMGLPAAAPRSRGGADK